MAHIANVTVVVLWDHEIKKAAELLKRCEGKDATADDYDAAMRACWVALNPVHLLEEGSHITVMSAPAKAQL